MELKIIFAFLNGENDKYYKLLEEEFGQEKLKRIFDYYCSETCCVSLKEGALQYRVIYFTK